mmetsp:Transcript_29891/g.46867  ORF Transcript_29891/g.46867 Transcript_29891/m.46867 type:complete len:225 (-) Transcript_29891:92-766(-)
MYPVTRMGRISSVASCFVAVVLFALTVNWVLSRLSLTYNEENLLKILRSVDARRKLKLAAVRMIEGIYMRSPMYHRIKNQRPYNIYQRIDDFKPHLPGSTPEPTHRKPLGLLSAEEMQNLHEVLDDTKVIQCVRQLQQSRKNAAYYEGVHFADEVHQVSELAESQRRLEKQVRLMRGQVRQLLRAIKGEESDPESTDIPDSVSREPLIPPRVSTSRHSRGLQLA